MYERGILSKDRTSVSLKHVRSVHITQGFVNRILGVGIIQISTAGDEPEFTIADMPDPYVIQRGDRQGAGNARRQGLSEDAAMPSQSDRRERNEALRLFIAAAVALLLLIVIGGAGFYYPARVRRRG